MNESSTASHWTEHVFEKKRQTGKSGFMKAVKCVAARFTKCCTTQDIPADNNLPSMLPIFPSPLFWTYIHMFVCAGFACVCVCVFIWVFVSVQCLPQCYRSACVMWSEFTNRESSISEDRVYSGLPSWGLHVEVYRQRSSGHILPARWHSAPVTVYVCVCASVCLHMHAYLH